MNYADQLKHPNWQRRRLERLEAAGWKCEECSATEEQLHVHHERYIAGRDVWDYEDRLLKVLCHQCHSAHHGLASQPTRRRRVTYTVAATLLDRTVWLLLQESSLWRVLSSEAREFLLAQPAPYDILFACFDRHIFEDLASVAMLSELRASTDDLSARQICDRLAGFHSCEAASQLEAELHRAVARLQLQAIEDELKVLFELPAISEDAKSRSRDLLTWRQMIKSSIACAGFPA